VLEAIPGTPGPPVIHQLSSPVWITSGQFYVSVDPVDGSGRPTNLSDSCARGYNQHSWYGSAGNWTQYTSGEWLASALVFSYYCKLVVPNGGEHWASGDTHTVTWSVSPKDFSHGKLLLSTDGGNSFPSVIATGIAPNETTFNWTVPSVNSASCRVKFQALDSTGSPVCEDASDANFTIGSQSPPAPALIYPPDSGAVNNQTVVFRWHRASDVSGTAYYTIRIAYDSMFGALADTARLTDTTYARSLPGDTSYYWHVRATDSLGHVGPWSQTWKFEIDLQTPEPPTQLDPTDGQWFKSSTIQFHWTPVVFELRVCSPIRYVIGLDTIQSIRPMYADTTVSVYDTFSFLPEHRYWWHVRACDLAGNQGQFSPTWRFGIDMTGPLVPSPIYPPNYGGVQTDTVSLVWHKSVDAVSGTSLYHAQLARDSLFVDTIALPGGPTLQDTMGVANLPGTAAYFWRVRAQDTVGNWSNWSLVRKFTCTIGIAEQPSGLPGRARLGCVPNPSRGRTAITLALPSATSASVAVYDPAGARIAVMWNGPIPAGWHTLDWDSRTSSGRAVAPGVYFVRATAATLSLVVCLRVVQ